MTSLASNKVKSGKIHFVHHLEKMTVAANVGDWICCPYYYFIDFFSRYTCVLHSDWSVLWHEIEKDDIVIFGGGGLLDNSDELNKVLNRLIEKCNNVIIWGAGTHKYSEDNVFGAKTATTQINFDKVLLCGVRDYNHPYNQPFLPCVSCLNPAFNTEKDDRLVKRKIGSIISALEPTFAISDLPSCVSNAAPIGSIVEYILSSKVILVSSYHGAYWAMLLGRKAILPSSRLGVDKYRYFRHPVGFYDGSKFDEGEILHIASEIPEQSDFLQEAQTLNLEFFNKVRIIVESIMSRPADTETTQIVAKRVAQLEFTVVELSNQIRRMNGVLADTVNKVSKSNET